MQERVKRHKKERPKSWKTLEEPLQVNAALKDLNESTKLILLDCLTFWVSNLILHYQNQGKERRQLKELVLNQVSRAVHTAKEIKPEVIIVSNEVGMSIVPKTSLGRIFRDTLGKANQIVAAAAGRVFFMTSGLPIKVK
jgi:adenosylcobinamide kinase/adenosylcobinamide-phosphate guanylyltransferase